MTENAQLQLWNAHLEIAFDPQLWAKGAVITINENGRYVAAPNGNEDLIDTFAHELAHHLVAQMLWGSHMPSQCIGADRWTPERRLEEQKALDMGTQIAAAMRTFMEAQSE